MSSSFVNNISSDVLCPVCLKVCKDSQKGICCDVCDQWLHRKCAKISLVQFQSLGNSDSPFYCHHCLSSALPFVNITKSVFNQLFSTGYVRQCSRSVKFPCKHCKKPCQKNQNCICCDVCKIWIHVKCTALTMSQFKSYSVDCLPYFCSLCLTENLPLNCLELPDHDGLRDDDGYLAIDNIDSHFKCSSHTANDLIILHINTRSLTKNIERLEELICLMKYQPDVIAISETKLNDKSNLNLVQLPGYQFVHDNSMTQAGGVALYVKTRLHFNVRHNILFHAVEYESVWIEIINKTTKLKNIILGVLYRHPQNSIPDFTDKFSDLLDTISTENKDIYVTGDFNIDTLKMDSIEHISDYFDMLSSYSCSNAIKSPTRITANSKTSIDHFYYNDPSKTIITSTVLSDISDHFPLLITIKNSNVSEKQESFFTRNYTTINNHALVADTSVMLSNLKKSYISDNSYDTNKKFELFTQGLKIILDKHAPLKKLSRKESRLKSKPWITVGIQKSIKTRNRLWKDLCRCKFKDKELHDHYKKFRNRLTHIKEKSKQNHYQKLLQESKGDSRKTWEIINKIIKKGKKSSNLPSKLEKNGITLTSKQEILNGLNAHFATIGKQNCTGNIDLNKISQTITKQQQNSIVLQETTEAEVSAIISGLNSKKASGADELSITLLKKLNSLISPILSSLINESFKTGTYPDCLKIAKVIAIYKGGTKSCPGNYRPISLLSNINKIIEKIIYSRLISFFETYNIINMSQFGFRQGYSTTMAVAEFYEDILESYDKGKATCAVLLDLSKAFDSVNREILLFKLHKYGIRGNAWNLLHSYLNSREQFVFSNNDISSNAKVDVGVPQGSVLGPLLFLIHINDLSNSTNMKVLNFADDTLLYIHFDSPRNIGNVINSELENVSQWLNDNQLQVNCSKTKYLVFSPNSPKFESLSNLKLYVGINKEIERVSQYKYLGLIIDDQLTWNPHIKYIKGKLSQSLGLLYRTRKYLDRRSLILILHSLFISHLQYGILCWGRCSKTSMDPLLISMNKAIKCINFKDPRLREKETLKLFHKDKILQVNDMFKLELAKFMYKYYNRLLPANFNRYFTSVDSIHNYNTRASGKNYFVPRKDKTKGLSCLSYRGAKLWSEVPVVIKDNLSLPSFTFNYKKELLEKYIA